MAKKIVSVKELQKTRAKYVSGVSGIDAKLSELEKYVSKAKDDRIATLGAIQAIDLLIASVAPTSEPTQPAN